MTAILLQYRIEVIGNVLQTVFLSGAGEFELVQVHQLRTTTTAPYAQDAVVGVSMEYRDLVFARPYGIGSPMRFCWS